MNKLLIIILLFGGIILTMRNYIVPKAVKNDWQFVDFKTIQLPSSPNYYLSCPENYCPEKITYAISPTYHLSVKQLQSRWDNMIGKQPRTSLLATKNDDNNRVYVQLSKFWNFPDFINVQFCSLGNNRSSIAIFSQSRFGHSDFGVNEKRVKQWFNEL